jgi:phosphinothricin acetyltransferase
VAPIIRLAAESDAASLLQIYAPIVEQTPISFEFTPPTVDEFCKRIRSILASHVWIVCEENGQILGYAYASRFRFREAYDWTTEVTIYVAPEQHRRGVGHGLYGSLLAVLRVQGFCIAIAGITLPNEASVRLHEKLGFRKIGVFHTNGYKFGQWHDIGFWELSLRDLPAIPVPLRPQAALAGSAEWNEALAAGLRLIRPAAPSSSPPSPT